MRQAFFALTKERQGEMLIFTKAALWSFFPIVTALSLNSLPPLIALGWATLFAIPFFGVMLTLRHTWSELKNTAALKDILWVTILNAVLYYGFYFLGLQHTTPGNASLIALTEILFSFLYFNVWRKDAIATKHLLGAALMVLGAMIVLFPTFTTFNPGDILIVLAMMSSPIGNHFQQKARKKVSSETIMFMRSVLALPFIVIFASIVGNRISLHDFRNAWFLLAVNGIVLFGLVKILWIESIHRIPVTKALSLSSVSPLLTLFFAWLILRQQPTPFQLLAFSPLFFGVFFLTRPSSPVGADGVQ